MKKREKPQFSAPSKKRDKPKTGLGSARLDPDKKPSDYERYKAKKEREKARAVALAEKRSAADAARKKRAAELELKRKLAKDSEQKKRAEKTELRAKAEKIKLEKSKERARIAAIRLEKRKKVYAKAIAAMRNRSGGFDYNNIGFLPRVALKIRGDGATVAAKFASAGIKTEELGISGGNIRLKIRKKDYRKAIAILDEICYNYQLDGSYGVTRMGAFMLMRAGLLVGAAVSFALLNILYSCVWKIEISGNDKLSCAAVMSVLQASGIVAGLKKSSVDRDAVSAIVGGIDGVSDAGCEIVGTTLHVYVLESKDFAVLDKYGAYYSRHDATVTRIVTRSGTARVRRGDVVKAGDVLIDGNVYSTAGEVLFTERCDGEVYGEISLVYTAELGTTAVEYVRTGKVERRTEMTLFGHKLFKVKAPFASYESVRTTANYDVLIPLYVSTYEFRETVPTTVECDIDELARSFAENKAKELEFVGDFETQYTVTSSVSGLYSVHVFLSGEALISRGGEAPAPIDPPQENK